MKRTLAASALGLAALAAVALSSSPAAAHAIGLSTGEYAAKGEAVQVKLAFARGEVAGILPGLDDNRDGHVTALEVETAKKELESRVLAKIRVSAGGAACAPVLTAASLTEQDGLTIDGRFDCATSDKPFDVDVALLDDLSHGHRHVARAVGATTHDEVLYKGHATFSIAPLAGVTSAVAATPPAVASEGGGSAWAFFKMGIEHILTGYDHLVFLFGLVLLRARLKELLAVVTAFTVAHSITLAISVLGIFTPSAKFVEPAIALSIAYVGIENFFVKDGSKRWRITFPFGLIHGFGFAGALREINLPSAQVPAALVTFNLGVEAGQLFAMSLVLPMVMLIRQKEWFEPRGVRVLSGAVALAGGFWFVMRIAGG
ncbi:MAG TPA: HupE/UreJ family protein [Labilithrix sp.]|nr:HupE/UreJ family protein [Labilithrix sp.]